jgi:UDP-N-acetylglucosamine 1-carboxyvinyltransferase
VARATRLQGREISFDTVTVTGTENLMMAAALADGVTVLNNAAREPEVVDLAELLNKMGARIEGAGRSVITIEGVERLGGAEHTIIPDRIETATFAVAAAITGGCLEITNCNPQHITSVLDKMRETGVSIEQPNAFSLRVKAADHLKPSDVTTMPHPGFPTDVQAQYMALMALAGGVSLITETIFENRFMHASELLRMGANIHLNGRQAVVEGRAGLMGARVQASDLRASASLVLAGLAASGETIVDRVYHIDRGYEKIEEKLGSVGAEIERFR